MDILITAKNSDEFQKIESELKKLPENVYSQLESAKIGTIGIECVIREDYKETQNIYLPKTKQITNFGDFIGIYAGDFFFKIQGNLMKKKVSYIFLDYKE